MDKRYRILLGLLVLLLVLLCGCTSNSSEPLIKADSEMDAQSEPPVQDGSSSEKESSPIFITFEGADLEGNVISQEIFSQSKLTMVNVWATYCNPCLQEMPGLGELAEEYDQSEFQIIGIVSDVWEGENQNLVENLIQQTGANYSHLLVNNSINYALLTGVTAVPTTFFFDGEGAYLGGVVGSAEKSAWEELINELLEES